MNMCPLLSNFILDLTINLIFGPVVLGEWGRFWRGQIKCLETACKIYDVLGKVHRDYNCSKESSVGIGWKTETLSLCTLCQAAPLPLSVFIQWQLVDTLSTALSFPCPFLFREVFYIQLCRSSDHHQLASLVCLYDQHPKKQLSQCTSKKVAFYK